ncbi:Atrial natriuretic peptide receptor 2 [Hypsibius exemplaris]|uniref:guanylate cyclase n=1 Tax=Hypsibius exemplaris TaxID=2072580 RepID=A0A1W0X3W4_HYPEX|nr:Atrial natriuretic peptide receptor 2 [Hypsibius exemplaris]
MSPSSFLFIIGGVAVILRVVSGTLVVPFDISNIVVGDGELYGRSTTSPAYDVALERARQLYPRIFRDFRSITHYHEGKYASCTDSEGEMLVLLSGLYDSDEREYKGNTSRKQFAISPGCSGEIFALGDLGRDTMLWDDARFPTLLTLGPSAHYSVIQAVLELLRLFRWNDLSVIADDMSQDNLFYPLLTLHLNSIHDFISVPGSGVTTLTLHVDSTVSMSFEDRLKEAATHSSIIMIVSASLEVYLTFLVFLILQLNQYPLYDGPLAEREALLIQEVSDVLPFVFELTPPPLTTGFGKEWEKIANRSRDVYNHTIRADLALSAVQLSAYDSLLILAQVINETYDILPALPANDFISRFRNRTFTAHLSGPMVISRTGRRMSSTYVRLYSPHKRGFVDRWKRTSDGVLMEMAPPINWEQQWKGHKWPAVSKSQCRELLLGQDCLPVEGIVNANYWWFTLISFPAAAFVSAFAVIKLGAKLVAKDNAWWKVDADDVNFDGAADGTNPIPPYRLAIRGLAVNLISLDGRELIFQHACYKKKEIVQVIRFNWNGPFRAVHKNKASMKLLKQIRSLDHPNLAYFYGFALTKTSPMQMYYVTESPKKGFLRNLIDSNSLAFNWDLRASLIWDLLRGLRYIHASPLRYHGVLAFFNLIIDEHFTLKIDRVGGVHFYHSSVRSVEERTSVFPIMRIGNLWMAPEAMDVIPEEGLINLPPPGPAADIFSLGVILYEMSTRNPPFNVDIVNITAIKDKIREIRLGQLDVEAYPMEEYGTPQVVISEIKRCWSFNPASRPTIEDMTRILDRLHPGTDISVAEGILRKLAQYSQELEATVVARKEALYLEMVRVDALLSNVLPKSIVQKLRNGEVLVPDYFSSVTVMLSDIPAFNKMVAKCQPFSIVDLLHRLYSAMDQVIDQHDAYKVETIKDSYMVASGLPIRNGDRHASEIAQVALAFLTVSSKISSPEEYAEHCPNIRLRIGLNTGPCVAAVIGQKQPHYCLVGDTVNTASRMETHGEVELNDEYTWTSIVSSVDSRRRNDNAPIGDSNHATDSI